MVKCPPAVHEVLDFIYHPTPKKKKVKQEDITWPNNLTAEHILKRSNSPSIVIRKCFYVNVNFCLLLVIS